MINLYLLTYVGTEYIRYILLYSLPGLCLRTLYNVYCVGISSVT
jgi:hypothetical protein